MTNLLIDTVHKFVNIRCVKLPVASLIKQEVVGVLIKVTAIQICKRLGEERITYSNKAERNNNYVKVNTA